MKEVQRFKKILPAVALGFSMFATPLFSSSVSAQLPQKLSQMKDLLKLN